MKQETIDLIKSMTGQGFLVIVAPEIYNGNETTVVISEKQEEERNPESSVIFTNCVGEVFTKEDLDKLLTALKALHGRQDFETSHEEADNLLYDFLINIGLKDVAEAYAKVGKWYA